MHGESTPPALDKRSKQANDGRSISPALTRPGVVDSSCDSDRAIESWQRLLDASRHTSSATSGKSTPER